METEPISVVVIGGYLGAGKTTLVNHLLRSSGRRLAVLVNDFGDINIDEQLIVGADDDMLTLANGCICCSLVDGFAAALATVAEFSPRPDAVVIEASGVAEPGQVAAYGHRPGFRTDAVVVVVDAETAKAKADDPYVGDVIVSQVSAADLVVMNKADLADPDRLIDLDRWLATVAPEAGRVTATQAEVAADLIVGPRLHGEPTNVEPPTARAEDRFVSWSYRTVEPVDVAATIEWVGDLDERYVRIKGVLPARDSAGDSTAVTTVQRVGRRVDVAHHDDFEATTAEARLVIIATSDTPDPTTHPKTPGWVRNNPASP